MDFVPTLAMAALIFKIVDLLRYANNRDFNGVFTQLITWFAGIVVAFLVAKTAWAASISVAGLPLSKLGTWSIVFAGASIGSGASVFNDARKAVDASQTAALPTLFGARWSRRPPATPAPAPTPVVNPPAT